MTKPFVTRREFRELRKLERRALKLQATEYERRLEALNGEHKTNVENWRTSVRHTTFEAYKEAMEKRVDALEAKEDERKGRVAFFQMLAGAGALGFAVQLIQLLGWIKN